MATSDQIKALIQSHVAQNDERFLSVAIQVAAHEARQGHGRVADQIKKLVDDAKVKASTSSPEHPIPIATPRGELAGLLSVSYPKIQFSDMVLQDSLTGQLQRVIREQRAQSKLNSFGLTPRRKLLLVGPPGCGKTMTAAALAGELHLPLYVIVLDSLITKFMGETAAKLRLVFSAIFETRGVYLFDEFDAIGNERASSNDVGEMRRVLNSFLQFLEQDESQSLVVAATNHAKALDKALFRRFDDVLKYELPSMEHAANLMKNRLSPFDTKSVDWLAFEDAAQHLSHAEIAIACDSAAKEAVLSDSNCIATELLLCALKERQHTQNQ